MSDKHTPGPWEVRIHQQHFPKEYTVPNVYSGGFVVAECAGTHGDEKESLTNANLIAAAPKLLAALEKLYAHTKNNHQICGRNFEAEVAIKQARGDL